MTHNILVIRKLIGLVYYHMFARYLPNDYWPMGRVWRSMRSVAGKLILDRCGEHVNIKRGAIFHHTCELGNNSDIGVDARLHGRVIIGDYVMMGPNVVAYTRNHKFEDLNQPIMKQGATDEAPIRIEDDVWIGDGSLILPGVVLGSHSVVAARSVFTKDVLPFSVVAGVPARVVRDRRDVGTVPLQVEG